MVLLGKDFLMYHRMLEVRQSLKLSTMHVQQNFFSDISTRYYLLFPKHNVVLLFQEEDMLNVHMLGILLYL